MYFNYSNLLSQNEKKKRTLKKKTIVKCHNIFIMADLNSFEKAEHTIDRQNGRQAGQQKVKKRGKEMKMKGANKKGGEDSS